MTGLPFPADCHRPGLTMLLRINDGVTMKAFYAVLFYGLISVFAIPALAQSPADSPSHQTFLNPVIPGDHPDPTLTRIDGYFYTSGSSFNPTPKIYRSTNLVHWEVIAQPVTPEWTVYGNNPGGGVWGGHTVRFNNKYWHYFGRGGGRMYFVTANLPTARWSYPVEVSLPPGLTNLGVDNSIFIDEDYDRWYMLTKAGHENNHIVELGPDGQPNGNVLDLTWLNPTSEGNPYGWAEGPVMWKYNGYYYYSFAEHLVGQQYVMRSDTLTDNPDDWTIMTGSIFFGSRTIFDRPNHISPAVALYDGTSWVIGHSYHTSTAWRAHGRQGLLMQVIYNEDDWPEIRYPSNTAETAPDLPSSGIPWTVPKSDMFNTSRLHPEWSFLGFTPENTISLSESAGWLYLQPHNGSNTIIKNDGEHQYSLITRVDFEPDQPSHQAGLWIFNGPETLAAKVYSGRNDDAENVLVFSYDDTRYEAENTIGTTVWLKLMRDDHMVSGYYSPDGAGWTQIGDQINASTMDIEQTQFNDFTGNRQGLFVEGKAAYFDLYIYRDAYTRIAAKSPANRFGVTSAATYLGSIHNDDWALYAGVEFGNSTSSSADYPKSPGGIRISAASAGSGGTVEVWTGAIETGQLIGTVNIGNTGGLTTYNMFEAPVEPVTGRHDVYLRFSGDAGTELFRMESFQFTTETVTSIEEETGTLPSETSLFQNYPNPFNPSTIIRYHIPESADVNLAVFDMLGRRIVLLLDGHVHAGSHVVEFDATTLASGTYLYRLQTRCDKNASS
jgi:xylan 1,4-beta-xylosidase